MIQVNYFVACSLDGFIAGPQDEIDWLFTDGDYGYSTFIQNIDFLIMSRRTYDQVRRFGDWPYEGKLTYVITNAVPTENREDIIFTDENPVSLAKEKGGNCWLVGGGILAKQFLKANAIDIFHLSIHPVLLGGGKSLFPNDFPRTKLKLLTKKAYDNGLVQLSYQKIR